MAGDITQQVPQPPPPRRPPPPPPVPPTTIPPEALAALTPALVGAIESCAERSLADDSAAEVKDYGAAALAFAQALITLDPSRLGPGATPAAQANAQPPQAPPTPPVTPKLPPTKDGNRNGVIGG